MISEMDLGDFSLNYHTIEQYFDAKILRKLVNKIVSRYHIDTV